MDNLVLLVLLLAGFIMNWFNPVFPKDPPPPLIFKADTFTTLLMVLPACLVSGFIGLLIQRFSIKNAERRFMHMQARFLEQMAAQNHCSSEETSRGTADSEKRLRDRIDELLADREALEQTHRSQIDTKKEESLRFERRAIFAEVNLEASLKKEKENTRTNHLLRAKVGRLETSLAKLKRKLSRKTHGTKNIHTACNHYLREMLWQAKEMNNHSGLQDSSSDAKEKAHPENVATTTNESHSPDPPNKDAFDSTESPSVNATKSSTTDLADAINGTEPRGGWLDGPYHRNGDAPHATHARSAVVDIGNDPSAGVTEGATVSNDQEAFIDAGDVPAGDVANELLASSTDEPRWSMSHDSNPKTPTMLVSSSEEAVPPAATKDPATDIACPLPPPTPSSENCQGNKEDDPCARGHSEPPLPPAAEVVATAPLPNGAENERMKEPEKGIKTQSEPSVPEDHDDPFGAPLHSSSWSVRKDHQSSSSLIESPLFKLLGGKSLSQNVDHQIGAFCSDGMGIEKRPVDGGLKIGANATGESPGAQSDNDAAHANSTSPAGAENVSTEIDAKGQQLAPLSAEIDAKNGVSLKSSSAAEDKSTAECASPTTAAAPTEATSTPSSAPPNPGPTDAAPEPGYHRVGRYWIPGMGCSKYASFKPATVPRRAQEPFHERFERERSARYKEERFAGPKRGPVDPPREPERALKQVRMREDGASWEEIRKEAGPIKSYEALFVDLICH
ncbi:MAG: hypothetical protein M1831_000216 [Alyxoria varia]|nr:MAG: hypothetical protein M1831_000216 [Alyxoria varia]